MVLFVCYFRVICVLFACYLIKLSAEGIALRARNDTRFITPKP